MNKYIKGLLIGDGILLLYSFLYAFIFEFNTLLKISFFGFLTPVYLFLSMGILGIIFIYSAITEGINTAERIIAGITAFIVILFPIVKIHMMGGFPPGGLLAAAALPGFPFAGGVFIHFVFEHGLESLLGFILAIKSSLLLKTKRILKLK